MTYCPEISENQTTLNKATDASFVKPILEEYLSEAVGIEVRIAELAIPRVFVRTDGMVFIQYMFSPQNSVSPQPDSNSTENVIVYGELGDSALDSHNNMKKGGKSIFIEDLQMTLHVFPFDSRLRQLSKCFASGSKGLWFKPTDLKLADSGLYFSPKEVLAYRYGKRSVIRGELHYPENTGMSAAPAYLKISRPRYAAKALTAQDIIEETIKCAEGESFALAKNIFTNISGGLIISEAVSSPTLYSMLGKSESDSEAFVSACYRIGRLLKNFQTCPVPDGVPLPIYTAEQEVAMLEKRVSLTSSVAPDYSEELRRTLSELGECPVGVDTTDSALSHCDFYDKQLFVGEDKITLIDFDTLSYADPAVDMANFLAHLSLRMRQDFIDKSTLRKSQEKFMEGFYGTTETQDAETVDRLRWWYKATLVRLAALYALRPNWKHLTDILVADSMLGLHCESQ